MKLTKLQRKAALDLAFSQSKTMTPGEYSLKLAMIDQEPAIDEPPAPTPELYVTIEAMRVTLATVANSIAPLLQRLDRLEKKLQTLESKQNGVTIAAEGVSIDGFANMAGAIAMLNATLAQPIKPVYNAKGILTGARRVDYLDND